MEFPISEKWLPPTVWPTKVLTTRRPFSTTTATAIWTVIYCVMPSNSRAATTSAPSASTAKDRVRTGCIGMKGEREKRRNGVEKKGEKGVNSSLPPFLPPPLLPISKTSPARRALRRRGTGWGFASPISTRTAGPTCTAPMISFPTRRFGSITATGRVGTPGSRTGRRRCSSTRPTTRWAWMFRMSTTTGCKT